MYLQSLSWGFPTQLCVCFSLFNLGSLIAVNWLPWITYRVSLRGKIVASVCFPKLSGRLVVVKCSAFLPKFELSGRRYWRILCCLRSTFITPLEELPLCLLMELWRSEGIRGKSDPDHCSLKAETGERMRCRNVKLPGSAEPQTTWWPRGWQTFSLSLSLWLSLCLSPTTLSASRATERWNPGHTPVLRWQHLVGTVAHLKV